ncbi:hypothetical protein H9L39_04706 [Fusarium oxysporum f. sp. albedinis]|nr:hypothetical protein H9L39_04706 [Fusarium oxysporum f. sp. albedinis]
MNWGPNFDGEFGKCPDPEIQRRLNSRNRTNQQEASQEVYGWIMIDFAHAQARDDLHSVPTCSRKSARGTLEAGSYATQQTKMRTCQPARDYHNT